MRAVALVLGVAVASFALAGCSPGVPAEPTVEPSASAPVSSSEPSESPTAEPAGVSIPDSCGELVPIGWVHGQYGPDFEEIPIADGMGSEDVTQFRDRGGLACMWGLPASEYGITVFVAPRATATDADQVELWEAAGYSLGPDFLDATYFEHVVDDFGDHMTVWTLVEGFELKAHAPVSTVDPLLIILREATENMGYV